MEEKDKIVNYYIWCPRCAHYKEPATAGSRCDECMDNPVTNTGLPDRFEWKDDTTLNNFKKHQKE